MAVPKTKVSKSRKKKRRASNWKVTNPTLVKCPHCKTLIKPHTVCYECGYYNGKEVVTKKENKKEKK